MKRIITYLYTYDNGHKGKNVGFIKTDIRGAECVMEAHINGCTGYQGKVEWYLLVEEGNRSVQGNHHLEQEGERQGNQVPRGKLVGIPLGEFWISHGHGSARQRFAIRPIEGTDYDFSQVAGVGMPCNASVYLASCWKEEYSGEVGKGEFVPWERKKVEGEPEEAGVSFDGQPASQFEKKVTSQSDNESVLQYEEGTDSQSPGEAVSQPEVSGADSEQGMQQEDIKRIDLSDIKKLPSRNWYLCSNSFLLHGFFNYHYLIIKKVVRDGKEKFYLGVPGIYEKPERVMATLFGFPEFEKAAEQGEFGYWLCLLDM